MSRILLAIPILALFAGVLVGGHWYIAQRVVLDGGWPEPWKTLGVVLVVAGAASLILQPIGERVLRPPWSRVIAWPASLWMGLFFYAFWLVTATDLGLGLLGFVGSPDTAASLDRARAAFVGVGAVALVAVAMRSGLTPPRLVRVEIALPRWPKALDGFRIAQISDIHIGPILDRRFARHLTERVNALDADLVAVTGDLVDGKVDKLYDEVAPFAELRARHGVYFVTGNHDHYSGGDDWAGRAGELGMRVLRNEHVILEGAEGDQGRFVLAGVDDHRSGMMPGESGGEDLDAALADLPGGRAVVLLAHDPGTFKRAHRMGIDLQISGHTHGGQIWPFNYMVRLVTPYVAGLYRRGDAWIYVSRGTGFWGPPMRLGSPAEITEITLRSGAPSSREATPVAAVPGEPT